MKQITFLLLMMISLSVTAQKKHVFTDTVTTIETRVDYSPDTIPVYFKELKIDIFKVKQGGQKDTAYTDTLIYERLQKGFVIWQVYHKGGVFSDSGTISGTGNYYSLNSPGTDTYYKTEYQFTPTIPGVFLYSDRKTVVKNKIISVYKR